jgi:hypothetical protein
MQGDWFTIHESEAPRPNDLIIERVYSHSTIFHKITLDVKSVCYWHWTINLNLS